MKLYEARITIETDDDSWTDQQSDDFLEAIEEPIEELLDYVVGELRYLTAKSNKRVSVNWNL